jgi:integrase
LTSHDLPFDQFDGSSRIWNQRYPLLFRDYLRAHPRVALDPNMHIHPSPPWPTVNRQTTIFGAAFKLAKLRGKVTMVPAIRRLPERNVRRGFFERADFEKVLQHLPDYLRDAAAFGYLCGWRRSEILALRWEWVQADRATTARLPAARSPSRTRRTAGGACWR